MAVEIKLTSSFERKIKKLSKKYRKILQDLDELGKTLSTNPRAGNAIPNFNSRIWKIRMPSSDMASGKSGGFRIIYFYYHEKEGSLYLLTIYPKNEQENIPDKEIITLLKDTELWGKYSNQPQDPE
jgi:mRNA-degrading endonuclease RelE of RelBE toxin-antitoxin system